MNPDSQKTPPDNKCFEIAAMTVDDTDCVERVWPHLPCIINNMNHLRMMYGDDMKANYFKCYNKN